MKKWRDRGLRERAKGRVVICWVIFFLMIVFGFEAMKLNLRDPREISEMERTAGRILFIGGFIWILHKIVTFNVLLTGEIGIPKELQTLLNERQEWIYNKCGGFLLDVLLYFHLFVTCTASLVDRLAYKISLLSLAAILILKAAAYIVYSRKY